MQQQRLLNRYDTVPELDLGSGETPTPEQLNSYRAAGTGENPADAGAAAPGEEPEQQRPQIRVLERSGGVLLREGQFSFEPSFQYTFTSVNRVEIAGFTVLPAIVVGQININERERESFVYSSTFRYGVTDTFEIEARIPYVMRDENQLRRSQEEGSQQTQLFNVDGEDLGDVELALHYQLPKSWTGNSFIVTNVRYKSRTGEDPFEVPTTGSGQSERLAELPTGSGFRSVTPSITAILPTDPAVVFGNISYEKTFEREVGGSTIDAGDQLGFSVGTGLSLNPNFSISLSYDHSTIFETERNGRTAPTSRTLQVGRFIFGGTYNISNNVAIDVQFGAGMTDDAPDVSANVSVPITFSLF